MELAAISVSAENSKRVSPVYRYLPLVLFIVAVLLLVPMLFLFLRVDSSPVAKSVFFGVLFGQLYWSA